MAYKVFSYSLKVWLLTLAAAPIPLFIGTVISNNFDGELGFATFYELPIAWLIIIFIGGIFSMLTFVIFYTTVKTATDHIISITNCKIVISLICVLLIMATFAAMKGIIDLPLFELSGYFPLCYYACAACFCWFCNLQNHYRPKRKLYQVHHFNIK